MRNLILSAVACLGISLVGCADEEGERPLDIDASVIDESDAAGETSDAGIARDAQVQLDATVEQDAALEADMGVPNATEPRPRRVTAMLTDGTTAAGEIVAVYDRTRWWNPAGGGLVYALFDPDRFAFGDADRSFTFVTSDQVDTLVSMAPVEQSYREFLAERGLEFVRSPMAEPAYVVMGNDGYHLDEDGFGDYAWDLQLTDEDGRRFQGTGAQNPDHYVWDATAVAPIGGTVFEVVQSGVDNPPGSYPEGAINNLVGIRLSGNFYAYLLHFRQDGVEPEIQVGDRIEPGTVLGRVGNSGVTLEPHLHVVLLWYDPARARSYSVPAAFADIEVSRTPLGPWQRTTSAQPDTGVWIR